jgi:flagellar motility protein MotE (MotC chaperone)
MSWSSRASFVLGLAFALGTSPAAAAEPAKQKPDTATATPLAECAREERAANELLTRLRERERELGESARLLAERERSADAVEQETRKRLSELETLRAALDERIAILDARADERMGKLADVYGRMPPERGAAVLDALDPDLAARILARMRPARSAALLAALPSARAAELSRRLLRPQTGAPRGSEPVAQAAPARVKTGTAASVP